MAVISVILCVEMARNAVTDPNITFADGMFSNQAVMNLVMAVFVTLFLGTEYSDPAPSGIKSSVAIREVPFIWLRFL